MPNETAYPYSAYYLSSGRPNNGICSTSQLNAFPPANATYYHQVTETQLKTLLTYSPVGVSFAAGSAFMAYSAGVFSCPTFTEADLNHFVTAIGYDTNGNYIIKNSWGTAWGDFGLATIDSTMDCGMKVWVFVYESDIPSVIDLGLAPNNTNDPTNNNNDITNNTDSTNTTTNLNKYSGNMILIMALIAISTIAIA